MNRSKFLNYLPLQSYLLVYIITCAIGCSLALYPVKAFLQQYTLNSGIHAPQLDNQAWWLNWLLVYICPTLLAIGFILTTHLLKKLSKKKPHCGLGTFNTPYYLLAQAFFYFSFLSGLNTLIQAGGFQLAGDWTHYAHWTLARWMLFDHISFFGFVNLYTFLPLSAAFILLSHPKKHWGHWAIISLPMLLTLGLQCLLFQKKPPLISILMWALALGVERILSQQITAQQLLNRLLAVLFICSLVFGTLLLIPISKEFSQKQTSIYELTQRDSDFTQEGHSTHNDQAQRQDHTHTHKQSWAKYFFSYTLMAPVTRTSIPSLYYVKVYPEQHPYYGFDWGQDILGYGNMPDDNTVVWHAINPDLPGGVTAPFQFALYSQVGLSGSLIGSFLIGVLLCLVWQLFLQAPWPTLIRSLLASICVLYSIYITMDSLRNSLLAAYGMIWGVVLISLIATTIYLLKRLLGTPHR